MSTDPGADSPPVTAAGPDRTPIPQTPSTPPDATSPLTPADAGTPAAVPGGALDAQRRTVRTLVVGQALGGVGVSTGVAVASLLATDLVDEETLAGLPQTTQVIGSALMAVAIARLMARSGRRPGLLLGYGTGALGAAVCVLSAVTGWFPLLLMGALLLGSATAANNQARFAATDLATAEHRARALSVVVWATTLGAVLGPNLVGPADDVAVAVGFPEFAGPFVLGAVGLALGGAVIQLRLRPDPLLLSRSMALSRGERAQHDASLRRAWRVVRARPRAAAAIVAIAAAHTVMVSVMVMTPLHMDHGGAELEVIGFVISMHVLGMFAFAPVVGWLTDRLGRVTIMVTGGAILLTSVVLAGRTPDGASTTLTWALFLLGLGWSFTLISCSALLVDAIPVAERPGVQGASDLVMGMAAAGGGALAGVVVGEWGYGTLNAGAGVVALAVPVAAFVVGFGSGARPLPDLQDASE